MNAKQQALLTEIVAEYVHNMADGHAKVKMAEVRAHLDDTYFGWIGDNTTRSMRMTRRMGISSGSPAPCASLEVDLQSSRGAKAESCQARVASAHARKSATSARASRCRLGWGLPIAGC